MLILTTLGCTLLTVTPAGAGSYDVAPSPACCFVLSVVAVLAFAVFFVASVFGSSNK